MKKIIKNAAVYQLAGMAMKIMLLVCGLSSTASLAMTPTAQAVVAGAEEYVSSQFAAENDNIEVKATRLDPRIKVPVCPLPVEFSAKAESLKKPVVAVKAQCPATNWYLYLTVKVSRTQPVVVLSTLVSPGTLITTQNVEVVQMDVNRLRNTTFKDTASVLGARVKRRLRSGQPITPNQLCYVCKGDNIVISASLSGLEIKTAGIAQQDGNLGDTIRVRNVNSNKTLSARVAGIGRVAVRI